MTDELTRRLFEIATLPAFRAKYRVGKAVGRGAMGVVFAGTQVSTGRRVAVKFMIELGDPTAVARLEREGLLLAKVGHPGLTRIVDAGSVEGHPYLVTELLTGATVDDRIQERGRLSIDESMAICREVLPALQACHDAAVVHRDLKPSNILYDPDGRARLADLGVARWLDAEASLTRTGQVIGTPRYVAPELLRGELATPAADIYSFGCTLFEMLTGKAPFDAPTVPELLRRQLADTAPRVDVLVPSVPTGIGDAVERALEKDPPDRHASPQELLDELELALVAVEDRTRSALAVPLNGAPGRPSRKAPALDPGPARARGRAAWIAGALALAVTGVVALALRPPPVTRRVDEPASSVASAATPSPIASASRRASGPGGLPPGMGDGDAVLWVGALARLGSYWGTHATLAFLCVSPDGKRLVTASHGTVRVWDPARRRLMAGWRSPVHFIAGLAVDAGAERVVLAMSHERMTRSARPIARTPEKAPPLECVVWDTANGRTRTLAGPSYCGGFALAPGGRFVAWHDALEGTLECHGLDSDHQVIKIGAAERPKAMAVAPDGQRLALLNETGVEIVDASGRKRLETAAAGSPTSLAWSPDGSRLAVGGARGLVVIDAASLKVAGAWSDDEAAANPERREVVWAPGGDRIAVRAGEMIRVLDARSLRSEHAIGPIAAELPFTLAGGFVAVETAYGFRCAPLGGAGSADAARPMRAVAVEADARFAVLSSADGAFEAWDRATGRRTALAAAGSGWALAGIGRDGGTVHFRQRVPGASEDQVHVVDVESGRAARAAHVPALAGYVPLAGGRYLLIHPNLMLEVVDRGRSKALVATRMNRAAQGVKLEALGPVDRGERRLLLDHPEKGLVAVDLLADAVRPLWSAATVRSIGAPNTGLFVEASREVMLGTSDGVVHALDVGGDRKDRVLTGPLNSLEVLAASPDGKHLVGGHSHGAIAAWDLPGGQLREVAPPAGSGIRSLGLDAAEGLVLAADEDGVLTAWKLRR